MSTSTPFTSTLLPGLFYYDNFLPPSLESSLHTSILSQPNAWKHLNNRTLQNWGGLPHLKGMLSTPLPSFLTPLLNLLLSTSIFPSSQSPNHVLINRYFPGQGIHPHVDGPAYKPRAAIVSLLAPILMDFYPVHNDCPGVAEYDQPCATLLLRPRSCLVLTLQAYNNFYHAIAERQYDTIQPSVLNARSHEYTTYQRQERISLTVRASCKTLRNPLLPIRH